MPRLNVRLKANSTESKRQQIISQVSDLIKSGKLKPGDDMPSTYQLSEQIGVSRELVQAAYKRLAEMRLIETFGTRGSKVRGAKSAVSSKTTKKGAKKGASKKK
jgi:DNA-binding FadR family transcriptional regulator